MIYDIYICQWQNINTVSSSLVPKSQNWKVKNTVCFIHNMCPNCHEIILDFCNSVDIFLTYITFSFMVQNKLLLLLHPFNSYFSRTTWVSWYQKGKTSLDLNKAKDDRVSGCSGISWTICKQSAPRCRQITTSTPHHSIFTGQILLLKPYQHCQKHWRHCTK